MCIVAVFFQIQLTEKVIIKIISVTKWQADYNVYLMIGSHNFSFFKEMRKYWSKQNFKKTSSLHLINKIYQRFFLGIYLILVIVAFKSFGTYNSVPKFLNTLFIWRAEK